MSADPLAWIEPLRENNSRVEPTASPSHEDKEVVSAFTFIFCMSFLLCFVAMLLYLEHKKSTRVYALDDLANPTNWKIPWHLYRADLKFGPDPENYRIIPERSRSRTWYTDPHRSKPNAHKIDRKAAYFLTIPEEEEKDLESLRCQL